jgi:lysophospholipase L1-like esterase
MILNQTLKSTKMKKTVSLLLLISIFNFHALFSQTNESSSKSSKWEKSITDFEKADLKNPPPKGGIEFVGSSSIRKWVTLEKDFAGYPVFNRGFGGSQIIDTYNFASRIILPYAPKMIFFHAGDNDLSAGKTPEMVFEDFKSLAAVIHIKLPNTELFYISLKPSEKRWKNHEDEENVNKKIQEFASTHPRIHYIDTYNMVIDAQGKPRPELFAEDQLHLNEAGYKLLAEKVRPYLKK